MTDSFKKRIAKPFLNVLQNIRDNIIDPPYDARELWGKVQLGVIPKSASEAVKNIAMVGDGLGRMAGLLAVYVALQMLPIPLLYVAAALLAPNLLGLAGEITCVGLCYAVSGVAAVATHPVSTFRKLAGIKNTRQPAPHNDDHTCDDGTCDAENSRVSINRAPEAQDKAGGGHKHVSLRAAFDARNGGTAVSKPRKVSRDMTVAAARHARPSSPPLHSAPAMA